MYLIEEITTIIEAQKVEIQAPQSVIQSLQIDSRKIQHAAEAIFIALKARRDGHNYLKDAYQAGVRNFIVSDRLVKTAEFPDANFLWVQDGLAALQKLAAFQRRQYAGKVIAITGSNGKTIVKEWLYELLAKEFKIQRSPKSYNSQIGVALSLWQLSNDFPLAIIEAGISQEGEMQKLADMIQPTVGILTAIGVAHRAGFPSKIAKIKEKMLLFEQVETLIYPKKYIPTELTPQIPHTFTWDEGESSQADLQVLASSAQAAQATTSKSDNSTALTLRYKGEILNFEIPFTDHASLENVLTCISVLLYLAYSPATIQARISKLKPVEMRLQLKKGVRNCSIIDDSYSNDLAALKIALDFLQQQNQHPLKTLILSDIPDFSVAEQSSLRKINSLLAHYDLHRVLLIGPAFHAYSSQLTFEHVLFEDTAAFIAALPELAFTNETILLKGARNFHFESISKVLTAKSHDTVLEINLNAIESNLNSYKAIIPKGVKMMAMVKAFSYGSGSYEIANILQFNKVDYLAVAFVDEGVDLRQAGITLPIMVMSPDENTFESLVSNQLEPEIYSFRILKSFIQFLKAQQITDFPIHIKVDTGMHRLGFMPEEIEALCALLKDAEQVKVQSSFSHLAAASDLTHRTFTLGQIAKFDRFTQELQAEIGYPIIKHIAATSGIVNWPSATFDMVRLGIGLYGVELDAADFHLQEASVLKTNVTQIKYLEPTETVGYGRMGKLARPSKIATVKIGYADGYSRKFGNGVGKMLIHGQLVPTVGNICMDMCMLDVTDITLQEEDEVIVFPDLIQAAKDIDTIPYELLVNISQRVKRVYFYE